MENCVQLFGILRMQSRLRKNGKEKDRKKKQQPVNQADHITLLTCMHVSKNGEEMKKEKGKSKGSSNNKDNKTKVKRRNKKRRYQRRRNILKDKSGRKGR